MYHATLRVEIEMRDVIDNHRSPMNTCTLPNCKRIAIMVRDCLPLPDRQKRRVLKTYDLLASCRGVKAANDIARKERLQRGVVKLDDEGKHLRGKTAVLRGEVDADNVGDRLGRIGFLVRFGRNINQCTRLGGIDCLC